jgi:threonyl-tRNA synthetase
MSQLTLTLPDKNKLTAEKGTMLSEILKSYKPGLNAVAAIIDNKAHDMSDTIENDCEISFIEADSEQGLDIIRHSTSHIMAEAVKALFPEVKVAIGPSIESGFYYDFDYDKTFSPDDLVKIEEKMKEIIKAKTPFEKTVLKKADAIKLFEEKGEKYKVELINTIDDDEVSIYKQGNFVDLCRGPHLTTTGKVKAFKLTSIAGAYWRGDEKNKMLQRIYGTAFSDRKQLKEHLNRLEEAKKRDHRKLGRQLDLFNIYDEAGAGLIVYHPKGAMLRRLIEDFEIKEHLKRGYQMVKGPQILKLELWEKSGHLQNYKENMYFTEVEGKEYALKPMNCLAHMLIYKSGLRSYRDLPIRYFELGTVNRHEKSGVLHGLSRVREFTQDDAHILCTPEQLNNEIVDIISFVKDVMQVFDFKFEIEISTRPEKSIGTDQDWERATNALTEALDTFDFSYKINEGDGAFYGPKIDFKLKDCLNRSWQCATIQCDFVLPERFDLNYIGEDGNKHRPVMLHRVILGSIERFMGILIEHYAGAFPTWLSPVQVKVITISDEQNQYAENIYRNLLDNNIRSEIDLRNESLNHKIREAQMQKIPYMLVIGNKEVENNAVAPRMRNGKNLGAIPLDDFINHVNQECKQELQMQSN